MRVLGRILIGQAVLLVLVVSLPWLVVGPVPGILRLTAPVLCPADQPDARIVEYSTDVGDGTGTSWTLVCIGPAGDVTEVGSWTPLAVVFGGLLLAAEAVVLPLQLVGAARRRRRGPQPPGSPAPTPSTGRIPFGVRVGG